MAKSGKKKTRKVEVKVEHPKIYLDYTERRTGGEADDPNDRWSSHADAHVDFQPQALTKLPVADSWVNETITIGFEPEVGDDVSLVVVRYDTGSTFGCVRNVWQIIGAFKDHHRASKVRGIIHNYSSSGEKGRTYDKFIKALNAELPIPIYPDWFGYFERYGSTEIHCMRIR
jgi:hypothetical protein